MQSLVAYFKGINGNHRVGNHWAAFLYKLFDTRSAARQWIASLPEYPTEDQVDRAMKGWGHGTNQLPYYPSESDMEREEGEVPSLIVSFQPEVKVTFIRRESGHHPTGEAFPRDPGGSLRIALEDNKYFSNFSGSCRDLAEDEGKYSGRHNTTSVRVILEESFW